jgi:hypothetical protein
MYNFKKYLTLFGITGIAIATLNFNHAANAEIKNSIVITYMNLPLVNSLIVPLEQLKSLPKMDRMPEETDREFMIGRMVRAIFGRVGAFNLKADRASDAYHFLLPGVFRKDYKVTFVANIHGVLEDVGCHAIIGTDLIELHSCMIRGDDSLWQIAIEYPGLGFNLPWAKLTEQNTYQAMIFSTVRVMNSLEK